MTTTTTPADTATSATTSAPSAAPSQTQLQRQARSEAEQRRQDAEEQAQRTIDKEAAMAVEETRRALQFLAQMKTADAMASIERAAGMIDVLVARSPDIALLPVDAAAEIIDTAPADLDSIRDIASAADAAMFVRDFPTARLMLGMLISEIRVRAFHLPLVAYPLAMREAARLLDQNQTDEARGVLQAAINSLVVIDRIIPLPLVLARLAISTAESLRDQDREAARRFLSLARTELDRAVELGYSANDDDHKTLSKTVSDLEKQLRGNENASSGFSEVKEKFENFMKRLTGGERSSKVEKKSKPDDKSKASEPQPSTTATAQPS
jgi:YfdX protein